MITRRKFLTASRAAAAFAGGVSPARAALLALPSALPEGTRTEAELDELPGKRPLIKLTYRPPNYETPLDYFRDPITPNDAFFVRYHLAGIPEIDASRWRLKLGGEGAVREVELGLDDLKAMPLAEAVAVNQCSGNRRGLVEPHVPGVQWSHGAMGCARWRGVRLRDLLEEIGVKPEAVEIAFDGADEPVLDKTPDFVKSLPLAKAMEETTLVAFEMNGAPLPHLNGFPARLVVPGWVATYWIKHLTSIRVLLKPEAGYWMKTAYRVPLGLFPTTAQFASQEQAATAPITEIMVNALISSHADGDTVAADAPVTISGVAWDGGHGLEGVEISLDGGQTWREAALGDDLGPFAFRLFSFAVGRPRERKLAVMARATNRVGETQPRVFIANHAGYNNNVIQTITLNVA